MATPSFQNWHLLRALLRQLTWALLIVYAASLGARWHWILDLTSHFTWQYAVGGILLSAGLWLVRDWKFLALAGVLALLNVGELYRHADVGFTSGAAPTMTVALYNRNVGPADQTAFKQWLTDNAAAFDVVVIQEAGASVKRMANELGSLYPFQIQEPRDHAFGMIILSRHEFREMEKINFPDLPYDNFAARFIIQPPSFKQPVTLYALHAMPPMDDESWRQRNVELTHVAERVGKDTAAHRLMLGDWNTTPYSPFFADLMSASRLTWKIGGPMPTPTWPTIGLPWLMQIKIDHILSSDTLALADMQRANPAHSDHYALIARFAEK